jgi:hypothetical protein
MKEYVSLPTTSLIKPARKLLEDAPISNVGGGQIAGTGIGPNGEPGKTPPGKKRKKGELPTTSMFTRKALGIAK